MLRKYGVHWKRKLVSTTLFLFSSLSDEHYVLILYYLNRKLKAVPMKPVVKMKKTSIADLVIHLKNVVIA